MTFEILTITLASLVLFLVYFARLKSTTGGTFLFSNSFLNRADESIFDIVKFVYKMYTLLFHNISTFIGKIPHKVVHNIHRGSHILAQKSSTWVDKITHKTHK